MNIKRSALLALLMAATSIHPAFAATETTTIRLNVESPNLLSYSPNTMSIVTHNTQEGLVSANPRDPKGGVVPGIASSWDISADGKTYTFHLRAAKWSDGSNVKAQDFLYGWHKLNPSFTLPKIGVVDVESATASNDNTLQVTFRRTGDDLIRQLANDFMKPLPQAFAQAKGDQYGTSDSTTLFNGPYVAHTVDANTLVLDKNPTYWDAAHVPIEQVVLYANLETSAAARLMSAGQLDQAKIGDTHAPFFDPNMRKVREYPFGRYVTLNTHRQGLGNVHIRRALMLATPHTYQAYNSNGVPRELGMQGVIPYGIAGVNGEYRTEYPMTLLTDLTKAKQELQIGLNELHMANLPPLVLLTDNQKYQDAAISNWWYQLGLNIQVQQVAPTDSFKRFFAGDFDLAATSWGPDYNDPLTVLNLYHSGYDYSHTWSDPSYDALLDAADTIHNNPSARMQKLNLAEQMLLDQAVLIPLYTTTDNLLRQTYTDPAYTTWDMMPNFKYATKTARPVRRVADFRDITEIPDYAKPAIEKLMNQDVLSGSNGLYDPNGQVTREQFVKMLVKGMGTSTHEAKVTFGDVPTDSWSTPYIYSAAGYNVVHGSQDAQGRWQFKPTDPVTRAEMATMIANVLQLQGQANAGTFADVGNHWGKSFIDKCKASGIFTGYEDGSFHPDSNATRSEAALVIDKTLSKLPWPHIYGLHE